MSAIEELRRWQAAGGHCKVLARTADVATVGLFTCDGGEEMGRVTLPLEELDGVEGVAE